MTAAVVIGSTVERQWSDKQQAVFDAVRELPPGHHLVIEALAGSGKTSTIVEAMTHTSESETALAVAFNKSIAKELTPRVPHGVAVMTLHGYGFRALRGRRLDDKRPTYIDRLLAEHIGDSRDTREARNAAARLVSLSKSLLLDSVDAIDAAADSHGIEIPEGWDRLRLCATVRRVLQVCREAETGSIDFDDMIWLPVVKRMRVPTFDWVFVDETQDLSPAQLELVVMAAGETGRIVAVGDRRQSIYGFRGADREAIPRMIERLRAKVLPLSISYRCPRAVVAEARRLVPAIEAAPAAAQGVVRSTTLERCRIDVAAGDFVVSRTNAPLISLAFKLIGEGRRAVIQGRDIGQGLAAFVRGTRATSIELLSQCVRNWRAAESKRLEALDRDATAVHDKADCLEALCEGCSSVADVIGKIERLFADTSPSGAVLLTSTHRAKGLEADRVWLLRDTYRLRRRDGSTNSEEANLLYVAITRSKKELIYVFEKEKEENQ